MNIDGFNKFSRQIAYKKYYSEDVRWNSNEIYQEIPITDDFIDEFKDKINWQMFMKNRQLDEQFLEKYLNKIWFNAIVCYQKVSSDFLEKHLNLFNDKTWEYISIKQNLSEEFLRNHPSKIYWFYISIHQKLSQDFIYDFYDKLNWKEVCDHQILTEDMIEDCEDFILWDNVLSHQKLSIDFVLKHKNKFSDWELKKYLKNKRKEFNLK